MIPGKSISQSQLKDCPLTKQDILHVYSDVFTGIGKFPGMPYKFQLKENVKPLGMHRGKCLYIYRMLSKMRYEILRS